MFKSLSAQIRDQSRDIDVPSGQPWGVPEMPLEELPGFIEALKKYGSLPVTQSFEEAQTGAAILGRAMTEEELAIVWGKIGLQPTEELTN